MASIESYESIAGRLGEIHKRVRRRQEKVLDEYHVSLIEYHIIVIIKHAGECSQSDIAAALDVDKALISRQLKSMEEKGYLRRDNNPECKRKNMLSLSQKSLDLIPELENAHRSSLEHIFAGLNDKQITELQNLLEGLVNRI